MTVHGTETTYRRGCRCKDCLRANRRNNKRRVLGLAGLVDAEPIRRYWTYWTDQGWTASRLAAVTGTTRHHVKAILAGEVAHVRIVTAHRILTADYRAPQPGDTVLAEGTRRRLRALARIGWPAQAVADRCGVPVSTLRDIIVRAERCRTSVAAAVAAVYEDLSGTIGPSTLSTLRAARKGWPPPMAWVDIDWDPAPTEVAS